MNRALSIKVLVTMVALGVALTILFSKIVDLSELGANLPVVDVVQDYMVGLIYAGLVTLIIVCAPIQDRGAVLVVWLFRACVVCLFMPVYEGHYDILDAYTYYTYGNLRLVPLDYDDLTIGTALIHRMNTVLCAAAADSYRALTVIYSAIGLFGGVLFYRAIVRIHGERNLRIFYLINLMPSVILWTSPISKDSLIFLALGASLYYFARYAKEGRRLDLVGLVFSMLGAGLIRPWWCGMLGASLFCATLLHSQLPRRKQALLVVGLGMAGSVGLVAISGMGMDSLDSVVTTVDVSIRASSLGGSAQAVPEMRSWQDALLFFPEASLTVLLRPFPWEAHNMFAFLASLENLGVLVLLVLACRHTWRFARLDPLVGWSLGFLIAWLAIYSFSAYQNLGTSVRYRAPLLPILVILAGGGVAWLRPPSSKTLREVGGPTGAGLDRASVSNSVVTDGPRPITHRSS